MHLFCLHLEASCLQLSFLAYSCVFGSFSYDWGFFTCSWSSFAYSGKVRLMSTSMDCKQRSSTVSKKAPTVSRKASPLLRSSLPCSQRGNRNIHPYYCQKWCNAPLVSGAMLSAPLLLEKKGDADSTLNLFHKTTPVCLAMAPPVAISELLS